MRAARHAVLVGVGLGLMWAAALGHVGAAQATPREPPEEARPAPFAVLNPRIPVGSIRFLGWSANSARFAWQQARPGTRVRPSGPIWVVRLDKRAEVEQRAHFRDRLEQRLKERGIRQRAESELPTDAMTDRDVVIRTSRGELLAVALRDRPGPAPAWLAVLHRLQGGYAPVTGIDVPGAEPPLTVQAWESPNHQRVALAITTGKGRAARVRLVTLPLGRWLPRSRTHKAVLTPVDGHELPAAVSPTDAGPRPARRTQPAPTEAAQPSKSP
jgi:hypothetical protein